MERWKLNIFVNAVISRAAQEEKTAQKVLEEYTKLTEDEKQEILNMLET